MTATHTHDFELDRRDVQAPGSAKAVLLATDMMRQIGALPDATSSQVMESRWEYRKASGARGEIARAERSALDPTAQPLQDFLDRILFRMAGLTDNEIEGLQKRLEHML